MPFGHLYSIQLFPRRRIFHTLDKLCFILDCDIEDIVEHIKE
ncbi:helix-turn-helix domain-containing protein [Butyrivibrio fibrisolvens]